MTTAAFGPEGKQNNTGAERLHVDPQAFGPGAELPNRLDQRLLGGLTSGDPIRVREALTRMNQSGSLREGMDLGYVEPLVRISVRETWKHLDENLERIARENSGLASFQLGYADATVVIGALSEVLREKTSPERAALVLKEILSQMSNRQGRVPESALDCTRELVLNMDDAAVRKMNGEDGIKTAKQIFELAVSQPQLVIADATRTYSPEAVIARLTMMEKLGD